MTRPTVDGLIHEARMARRKAASEVLAEIAIQSSLGILGPEVTELYVRNMKSISGE